MTNATKENTALTEALLWAGSKARIAHEVRVSEPTVHTWFKQGRCSAPIARLLSVLVPAAKRDPALFERRLRGLEPSDGE